MDRPKPFNPRDIYVELKISEFLTGKKETLIEFWGTLDKFFTFFDEVVEKMR